MCLCAFNWPFVQYLRVSKGAFNKASIFKVVFACKVALAKKKSRPWAERDMIEHEAEMEESTRTRKDKKRDSSKDIKRNQGLIAEDNQNRVTKPLGD